MKRPKQRNAPKPNYRLRIDRRKLFPHLPRDLIYKAMPDYSRPVLDIMTDAEGNTKGTNHEEESEH